jgi:putative membrane protein
VFYLAMDKLMPTLADGIAAGTVAHGALLGGLSLCVGLINAACMTF